MCSIEKQGKIEKYYKDCWQDFIKRFDIYHKDLVNYKEVSSSTALVL